MQLVCRHPTNLGVSLTSDPEPNVYRSCAPGYIGGTSLFHLIQHPKISDHVITIYIRSAEKAKGFEKLGFKTVVGSLDDVVDLERLTAGSDIIFQVVSSWRIVPSPRDVPATDVTHLEFVGRC